MAKASGKTALEAKSKFLPVKIDTKQSAAALESAERVSIFEIDGVEYTMSKAPRADIALEYLALVDADRPDAAAYYLLAETIGIDGYNALKAVKGLSDKQFDGVLERVQTIALPKARERQA